MDLKRDIEYLYLFSVSRFAQFFLLKVLFWIHNIFMILIFGVNFPLSLKLKSKYPYNNLMGKICSGNGIQYSNVTDKEESLHVMHLVVATLYFSVICYVNGKTSRYLKKVSPKGSGALFNKAFRYFLNF